MEQWNNRFVLNPFPTYIVADLMDWDIPTVQTFALFFGDVFIQNIHAGIGSTT